TGFAFTENILYLGNAFGEDQQVGSTGLASMTAGTFFVRIVLSPFAHPLFTVLTGLGFGFAVIAARHHRIRRIALPLLGLLAAMGLHALWNGSAVFGGLGFYAVYAVVMVPVFGLLTWLAIWWRRRELRTLAAELPAYATAGWLTPAEPLALSSMRTRGMARDLARHWHGRQDRSRGRAAARAVAEYESFATTLAGLRRRARHGAVGPDFAARERELLHHLWQRREVAAPALTHAARLTSHRGPHHGRHAHAGRHAATPYGQGYGYGPGQSYGPGPAPGNGPGHGQPHGPAYGQPQPYPYGYGYGDPGSVRPTPR
ncbi:PrsW family intramembrane metalloprotease, partial [Streptomyces rubiginosohelvolus]|uniref:PrsW family intramembrane metalloprotease n=1 Tax=Streptomyces rubiginosohelvolus TaxID=67362 RepID=UPI0033E0A1B5